MRIRSLQRTFVYHSPQYPGFTSWCGLWNMPDGSVMCSFTQATGLFRDRPKAPPDVRKALDWPPGDGREERLEAYDMMGLVLENVHLRSRDLGLTWEKTGSDRFRTCMNGITGEAEVALRDGALLRAVWGPYLPYDDVPRTGYLERSTDKGRTWSAPQILWEREGVILWPKRLRFLADGRLLAGGGLIHADPERVSRVGWFKDITAALFVSEDNGATWDGPIDLLAETEGPAKQGVTEEFDWAELPNGDLLCVLRADYPPVGPCRLQMRLVKDDRTWRPTPVCKAPFPYSGHPELLATRTGRVLHIATTGLSATADGGTTWHDLDPADGLAQLRGEGATPYYPRSVELPNGEILIVGHVGGDDGYGVVDQSVVAVRFILD